jgi:simple sugar transport system substrate-binding protein
VITRKKTGRKPDHDEGMLKRLAQVSMLALALGGIATGAQAVDVKSIAVLTPEEPTDFGWNQQGHDAAKAVAEKYGLEFIPATGLGYGDVHPQLREVADDGASLIIAHASGYNTAAPEVGAEKGVPVAIVDRPDANKAGAVADYTLSGHEGAYLAGVLAAKTSTTKSVGIVVSGEPPSWNSQSAAFAQGVKATDPSLKVLYAVIGPAAYSGCGRRQSRHRLADRRGRGRDLRPGRRRHLRHVAGGRDGQVDQWRQGVVHRRDRRQDLHRQGQPALVGDLEPGPGLFGDVEDLKADKFGTKGYSIQLSDDSVQLLHSKHIPDAVWADVSKVRDEIVGGSLKIAPVWEAAAVRALMTSVTDAPAQ